MQLEHITFHGDLLWAGREDGNVLVAVKPICDNLGIPWEGQRQRIKRDTILSEGTCILQVPSPGGQQETICLPLPLVPGWIFSINDRQIENPDVRAKVLDYKRECHDVLYRHFFGAAATHDTDTLDPEPGDHPPFGTQQWLTEIAMVRECRRIFGLNAARAMWPKVGLPMVPEMCTETLILGGLADDDHIAAFFAERCIDIAGHRTRFLDLWEAYDGWCRAQGRVPASARIFGTALKQRYRKIKTSVSFYVGVALRAAS